MTLVLKFTTETNIPVEVEGVRPSVVAPLSLPEIEKLPVYHGNEQASLADFFEVQGAADDEQIRWEGSLSGVHWIGAGMERGQMLLDGSAGRHVGSEMKGGRIEVAGDVGDWVGAEMRGGTIQVSGRAGHLVGAAYRGSPLGMRGGQILVLGDVGNEIGHAMRRGMIAVGGQAGDLIGFNMRAGTILVCGKTGIRHGAGMRRGTLIFNDTERPDLLPSFRFACRGASTVARILQRQLQASGFPAPDWDDREFDYYHGDLIEGGRGEVWMLRY